MGIYGMIRAQMQKRRTMASPEYQMQKLQELKHQKAELKKKDELRREVKETKKEIRQLKTARAREFAGQVRKGYQKFQERQAKIRALSNMGSTTGSRDVFGMGEKKEKKRVIFEL